MAVLGTVIGRGTAASKPGSPAEGYVYFSTDTGVLERYSGSAWEVMSGSPLAYLFNTSTSDADPGAGKIAYNNATPGSVTVIYIDDQAANEAVDLGAAYSALVGAVILFHSLSDDGDYILATIDSVTDGTGYWKLGVTIEDSGSLPSANDIMELHIFGGGGGGGGTTIHYSQVRPMKAVYCAATMIAANVRQGQGLTVATSTDTDPADTTRHCSQFASTTTGFGYVYVNDGSVDFRQSPELRFDLKLSDNDDGIFYGGLWDQTSLPAGTGVTDLGSAGPGIEFAGVRVINGTDTNYKFVTCDSTTQNVVDTGVAVDGSWHDFCVYTLDGGTTWKLAIDGVEVASTTSNVPSGTSAATYMVGHLPNTSSSRSFRLSYFEGYFGDNNLAVA